MALRRSSLDSIALLSRRNGAMRYAKRLAVRRLLRRTDSPTGARRPAFGINRGRDTLVAKRDDDFAAGFGVGI